MVDASLTTTIAAATAAVLAWALVSSLRWAFRQSMVKTPGTLAPFGPNALPVFMHTFEVLKNATRSHEWLMDMCDQFQGKPFRMKLIGQEPVTVLNTVELFEDVLKTQFECFEKGEYMCDNLGALLGTGIFAVDGVKWMHQRKTASNLFTMRTLRDSMARTVHDMMPTVDGIFQRAVASQEPIDLVKFFNRFTMEGFAKIGFGIDLNGLDAQQDHPFMAAFDNAQRIASLRFMRPRFFWKLQRLLQVGDEGELPKHLKIIDDTVLTIISRSLEARQARGPDYLATSSAAHGKDIVSLFLDDVSYNEKRTDKPFDPVFLRDIVVNFLIAGRDTTAQALSWLFFELSQNPIVAQHIRVELKQKLPQLFDSNIERQPPTMEQVQNLTYLEAVLKETLRLHPSVPINFKRAAHDTVLVDGTFISKGSSVQISSYCLGHAAHVWGPDAKQFRPERWIDPQNPDKLITVSAFKFVSFHAGPRMCLGMNLAMMEMKILVASVLSKFQLDVVPGQDVTYDMSLTLPIKGQFLTRVRAL